MSDYFDWSVGPQSDGTYGTPAAAQQVNTPWDVAGGSPAPYASNGVIDILKFGISAWAGKEAREDFLDYRRYEATAGGLFQQGSPAFVRATPAGGLQISGTMLLIGAGVLAFLVLKK